MEGDAGEHALAQGPNPDVRDRAFRDPVVQHGPALGLVPELARGDRRHGVDPALVEARFGQDKAHAIKAVMAVHNEISTGVTSRVDEIRKAIDRARHSVLFMVDTISSPAPNRLPL